MIAKWKEYFKELTKIEDRPLAKITMRAGLRSMLFEDLQHDIEKDTRFKSFAAACKYAHEQIPIRKDWK